MILQKGDKAPDFKLNCTPDQKLQLEELKGKNVILAFYPADWSPVCSDQMALYNEMLKIFKEAGLELVEFEYPTYFDRLHTFESSKKTEKMNRYALILLAILYIFITRVLPSTRMGLFFVLRKKG